MKLIWRKSHKKFENVSGFEGRLLGWLVGHLWPEYVRWRANGLSYMLICIRKRLEHFKSFGNTHKDKLSRKQELFCPLLKGAIFICGKHTPDLKQWPLLWDFPHVRIVFWDLFFTRDKIRPDLFEMRKGCTTWFVALVGFNTSPSDREPCESPLTVILREH